MARKTSTALATRSRQMNGHIETQYPSSGDTVLDEDASMSNGSTSLMTPSEESSNQVNGDTSGFQLEVGSSSALSSLYNEPAKLFDAINEISLLGIEDPTRKLQLPRIVAIGDQSAGKSSAIAAISGITVPRKAGMCTRCPSHLNLKTSAAHEPWSCTISLQKNYVMPQRTWVKQEPELVELARVTSSEQLQSALERAQKAALNPGLNPQSFMQCRDQDLPAKDQAQLSPNLVRLDIKGPSCPNLVFYDLPGIFNQTADDNDKHLVQDVQKLVKEYINNENNILLLAIALTNDIENSTAGRFVRESKGRHRCIGLLTKPDCLPAGTDPDQLHKTLRNEIFTIGHGYYVTKQPDQETLNSGINYEAAKAMEQRFFKDTHPWNTHLVHHRKQFGVPHLQTKLSDLLVKHMLNSLPNLRAEVEDELARIEARLRELPLPPGDDAQTTILRVQECAIRNSINEIVEDCDEIHFA